ncbi:MAG TPA: ABC transporter permease [Candidatus Limnocylindria bacterium]|jgi:NitT/TauT family transport system permease protein|nr:ABC transporter permease [Candidatus Limnocylindria bacterium]
MSDAIAFRVIRPRVRRRRHPIVRWYRRNERGVLSALGVITFFALWQVGSDLGVIRRFFFSSPTAIIAAGIEEVQLPRFWNDVRISALELGLGTLLSVVAAVPLGIAIGWYRRLSLAADPWLNFTNALPRAALVPLVVLWAGLGFEMKTIIVFLGGFFSIILPTVEGVRTVERQLVDVARSFRARQRLIFTSIVLPGTLPFIVSGLRIAVGRVLAGVIIAEFYAQTQGLGVMIFKAEASLQSDRMLFGVLLFTLVGILLYEGVGVLERYFQRWRPSLDLEETT